MPTRSILRRSTGALIGLLTLALITNWTLGTFFESPACFEPASTLDTPASAPPQDQPRHAQPLDNELQPPTPARVAQLQEAALTPEPTPTAGLKLRFLRGTTGQPYPDLALRLIDVPEDGDPLPTDEHLAPLAQGQTNAHGYFEAPAALRTRRFRIALEDNDATPRVTLPGLVSPPLLPSDGSALEIEVLGAWTSFEALVLNESGTPVPGAAVQFDFESPALPFSTREAPSTLATTDAEGLARFELVDPASAGGRLRIKAELPPDLRSATLELPPPLQGQRVELRLTTSAQAILRVESAAGSPLPGAMARLERLEPPFTRVGRSTDAEGSARFLPVEPGRYVASAEDPSTGSSVRSEFSLTSCQLVDMRLRLPPSDLPLAVAGRVLGPDGRPISWLWVSICVEGREEARLAPDGEGRFEYHRAACANLRVRLKAPFDGPQVEPECIDAAFGARDLQFVLGEAPRMGFTALCVVDAETGAPLGGVAAAVYRDSAVERIGGLVSALTGSAMSLASNEAGLLFVPGGAQMPRAHLRVEKRGYVRREIDLTEIALLPLRDGKPNLELRRGFVQRWLVRDARTGAPIAGAVATRGLDPFSGRPLETGSIWGPSAPSDARGILELSLPHAPGRVTILADGYGPRDVDVESPTRAIGAALPIEDTILLESAGDP